MKFEIGDKVSIIHYYKRETTTASGESLETAIDTLDSGEYVEYSKYHKHALKNREFGVICGKRTIKIAGTLMPDTDAQGHAFINQIGATYRDVYLVATRMNCLRPVEKKWVRIEDGV